MANLSRYKVEVEINQSKIKLWKNVKFWKFLKKQPPLSYAWKSCFFRSSHLNMYFEKNLSIRFSFTLDNFKYFGQLKYEVLTARRRIWFFWTISILLSLLAIQWWHPPRKAPVTAAFAKRFQTTTFTKYYW